MFKGRGAAIVQTARSRTRIWVIEAAAPSASGCATSRSAGANPRPGVWNGTYEHNHAIQVGGAVNVKLVKVRIRNVGGDGLYMSSGSGGAAGPAASG